MSKSIKKKKPVAVKSYLDYLKEKSIDDYFYTQAYREEIRVIIN